MAGRPVPGALNIGDGGGKGESRHLGCGLEKRPPYPRLSKLGGDAPRPGAGSFSKPCGCAAGVLWLCS
jgi:hypothetical protein